MRSGSLLGAVCGGLLWGTSFALAQVRVGADVLLAERMDLVSGKRVALVTNQTGRVASGEHIADVLHRRGVDIKRLFGPEHGIRGGVTGGESVSDSVDAATGIPVVSLYGKINKPTPAMLADVDVLLYDIQDVGARFYTYISTMALCMEAAAARGIPFVVLDRPDPLGGKRVDGPVLEDTLRSFVGIAPIPVVYGLTAGELARLLAGEKMISGKPELIVVPMKGWHRGMAWGETGLAWTPPSPNIPTWETAIAYPATCILEATNLSEGRGTSSPFQVLGAPFVDGARLAKALRGLELPGVEFDSISFTPTTSKHAGVLCHGILMKVVDRERFGPVAAGLHILREVERLHGAALTIRRGGFLRLMGSAAVYEQMMSGEEIDAISCSWIRETAKFGELREKYFLYL